jgi:NAD(P)-dependent dehydrogenase (short-subunit alcohol dehydrogenase family)
MTTSFVPTLHFEPYERLLPARLRKEYNGKTVLITGGGSGIGAFIARAFAQAGVAGIIIAGRTESSLKSTTEELAKAYAAIKVSYHIVDIASSASVKAMFDALEVSPDVLVNNAGYLSEPQNFVEADMSEWWKGFEINVFGTALVTQSFLQHRASHGAKQPGVVIAMNTFAAYGMRIPFLSAYTASKTALARIVSPPDNQLRRVLLTGHSGK